MEKKYTQIYRHLTFSEDNVTVPRSEVFIQVSGKGEVLRSPERFIRAEDLLHEHTVTNDPIKLRFAYQILPLREHTGTKHILKIQFYIFIIISPFSYQPRLPFHLSPSHDRLCINTQTLHQHTAAHPSQLLQVMFYSNMPTCSHE